MSQWNLKIHITQTENPTNHHRNVFENKEKEVQLLLFTLGGSPWPGWLRIDTEMFTSVQQIWKGEPDKKRSAAETSNNTAASFYIHEHVPKPNSLLKYCEYKVLFGR